MCNTRPNEDMYHVNWRLICMTDRGGTRKALEPADLVRRGSFNHAKHDCTD